MRKIMGVVLILLGSLCFAGVVPMVDQWLSASFYRGQGYTLNTIAVVLVLVVGVIFVALGMYMYRRPRQNY